MTSALGRNSRGPWLWVVLAILAWIFGHRLAVQPLHWEEPRRCLVAMEMIERGEWIVPRELGEPYYNKPPLHAWLIALASGFEVRRVGPLAARGVSVASLLVVCWILWRLGIDGRQRRPSAWPPLVFATSGMIVQFARAGEIDLLFTLWITAALATFEAGRRSDRPWIQWTASQALLAGGVLTKGWAPLFFYPPVLWLVWRGRARLERLPALAGIALLALLVGLWYVPYSGLVDTTAFRAQLGEQLADRTISLGPLAFVIHLLRYPVVAFATFLPWSLWFVYRPRRRVSELRERIREDAFLELAAVTCLWVVMVYAMVPGIRERYLIPAIPPLAMLLGAAVEHARARESPRLHAGALLLGVGLLYGLYFAGAHERRHARQEGRYDRIADAVVDALRPGVPIVIGPVDAGKDPGRRRKLAVALARVSGRVPQVAVPGAPPWEWVAESGSPPPLSNDDAAARRVVEADGIAVWRVDRPEARSVLDRAALWPPTPGADDLELRLDQLAQALVERDARPEDPSTWIWLGRRTAYLARYRDAIEIFDRALQRFPDEPRLLRHRGHRWITLRRPELALADLGRAWDLIQDRPDEIEPDGMPNPLGIPRSTLHGNIAYHLGLAHYLLGNHDAARLAWERALAVATNDDSRCAASYWLYLDLLRSGEPALAARLLESIRDDLDVIENQKYLQLLLFYRDALPLARLEADGRRGEATIGYGLGAWHLAHGRADAARSVFADVLARGQWAAFGHIAAEYDLARLDPGVK